MKKLFGFMVNLLIALALIGFAPQPGISQWCDDDVPNGGILPHPDNTNYTAKLVYANGSIVYQNLKCGTNDIIHVDPCNPWVLTFYVGFWEHHFASDSDQVKLRAPYWNWDDAICQKVTFEYIYPALYDTSMYVDSAVIKVTMWPHEADNCTHDPNFKYVCLDARHDTIYKNCWDTCLNERITFEAIDSCEVPNSAICRIEFDKPLPVELSTFGVNVTGNDAYLFWTTSSERNNSGFRVERYSDGIWKELGFVVGKGNSTTPTEYVYTDRDLKTGLYDYRLRQVDFNGNYEYFELNGVAAVGVPAEFMLAQNYPNPFNPTTTIVYGLPVSGNASLKIYDNTGKEVAVLVNEPKEAGFYTVTFRSNLPSGIYFYKLESGSFVTAKKMVIVK
ncbi:MAG: T9SS type A sorting domain-containing protein [Ignavibacteria bacterium]|nr:T9SS type A sorting domain-containing protein [Ignavibacteria bacterium]